ncbi:protein-L-isoaspartate O-methyltransferase family protein [Facilibium subflavum]|uniref:protein-L-isoaspartate O-methyltransferase family protein n=1 Tax=Facilibium subflavum TaxID=2219058 RepID=UPI000E65982E|nr:protein-L-isoaspartate O-methyltransferase [Facilibium subflavum]
MNIELAKENMIKQQIRTLGVPYGDLLDAIRKTPRDIFVPNDMKALAYADIEIPLNHGEKAFSPHTVTKILQAVALKKTDSVLEIGCGCGYLTALMAQLSSMVETCDIHEDFVQHTKHRLKSIGVYNVKYHHKDAFDPHAFENKHYDVIVISCKLPKVPQQYVARLNNGGRLLCLLQRDGFSTATLVTKKENAVKVTGVFDICDTIESKDSPDKQKFVF